MTTTDSTAHWLHLLREEAGRTSMARTARLLGYSTATISLVLAGKYPGKADRNCPGRAGHAGQTDLPPYRRANQ